MQYIAVIAVSEEDFTNEILQKKVDVSKGGGISVGNLIFKCIISSDQLRGQTFQGVIITQEAAKYHQLRGLIAEVYNYIRF